MITLERLIGIKLEIQLLSDLGDQIGNTYVSQLLDISDRKNIIIAAPMHESRYLFMPTNGKIRVIFFHAKQGLLSFVATIVSKDKRENVLVVNLRIESDFEKIQRRQHFRLDCNPDCIYRLISEAVDDCTDKDTPDTQEFVEHAFEKGITRNLSGNGAAIVVEKDIPKNALIEVVISLAELRTIRAICRVVRNTPIEVNKIKKFDLGLYFKQISPKDQDYIIRFIFDQQRKAFLKK